MGVAGFGIRRIRSPFFSVASRTSNSASLALAAFFTRRLAMGRGNITTPRRNAPVVVRDWLEAGLLQREERPVQLLRPHVRELEALELALLVVGLRARRQPEPRIETHPRGLRVKPGRALRRGEQDAIRAGGVEALV